MIKGTAAGAVLVLAAAAPATAADLGIEAATDLRRRGLSWSDGKAAIEAWGSLPIAAGLSLEGGAAVLRGSPRQGGADALGEAALRYTVQTGPWTLWADVQSLAFAGASGQGYGQLRGGSAVGIGPAQLSALVTWAPPQRAIGGSNVYLGGRAALGVVETPLTLAVAVGRSMGAGDGSSRADRLRPGGDYTDVRLDADYVRGAATLGVSFTATTIDGRRKAGGPGVLLRAAIGF